MTSVLTAHGKSAALAGLRERRQQYLNQPLPKNDRMPAGSPMVFACIACGAPIWVPEDWLTKPDTCVECTALARLGWLEE